MFVAGGRTADAPQAGYDLSPGRRRLTLDQLKIDRRSPEHHLPPVIVQVDVTGIPAGEIRPRG
jgi:hypothetical protein